MSTFGVDFAWGRPGVGNLQHAGVKFAARYLSHDTSGKNLDHAEAKGLSDAGIWIVVVWEATASRAMAGHQAGIDDAHAAEAEAKACGMPAGRPIYFAVDFDAQPSAQAAINAYLDGAASVLGKARVGIYGGYGPVSRALDGGHVAWAWQTYAWSGGQWDHRAQLHQYSNDHIIGGVGLDYDLGMVGDYGQWRIGVVPSGSTPSPTPTPTPTPVQEDDMPYGQLAEGPHAVTPIALPKGRFKSIGFLCDNGLQGLPPAALRVAVFHAGGIQIAPVTVDSKTGQASLTFSDPATTTGMSVRREDNGDVHVAYEVS